MNNLNIFLKLKSLLYAYQSHEYDTKRFLSWLKEKQERLNLEKRKKITWTLKAITIYAISISLIIIGLSFLTILFTTGKILWIFLTVPIILFFIIGPTEYILVISNIIIMPLDYLLKSTILLSAKNILKKRDDLIIIGITGSYGKTSMKEMLATIMEQSFRVLRASSSINTSVGIARLIIKKLNRNHQVLIVEMGAYKRGDISNICSFVKPKIGILTGINSSHLERFGTIENTIKTKFELAEFLPKKDGALILNIDNTLIKNNYKKFSTPYKILQCSNEKEAGWWIKNYDFKESGFSFDLHKCTDVYIENNYVKLLGKHNARTIAMAVAVCDLLNQPKKLIKIGLDKLKPVEHRLFPIYNPNDIIVIDDSYNGNLDGVKAAIKTLNEFKKRRKIFFTPGLVEVGKNKEKTHIAIGKKLADSVDLVMLLKNSNTDYFLKGLKEKNFPKEKILIFSDQEKAYRNLNTILKSGDVILFQNDWPDIYS